MGKKLWYIKYKNLKNIKSNKNKKFFLQFYSILNLIYFPDYFLLFLFLKYIILGPNADDSALDKSCSICSSLFFLENM
jgi:hypothetical protein